MKISIIIPPCAFLLDDRAFPFLGPLQIAAVARLHGHDVKVHDLTGFMQRNPKSEVNFDNIIKEASDIFFKELDSDTDLVGFYSLAAQHPFVINLHNQLKEKYPNIKTVIGGPYANTTPEKCKTDGFDFVVVSDMGGSGGEAGFLKLLNNINILSSCIVREKSRKGVKYELDEWPMPARDLIDLNNYHYYLGKERCTNIVTAAGCAFSCAHCCHWEGYRKQEYKSPQKVAEEIQYIKNNYGYRGIFIYDDEVNLRPDFTSEFLPMLKEQNIIWKAFFKTGRNLTQESVFEQMASSGCYELATGVESADNKILKDIKKGTTIEENTKFVKYCKKYNIHSRAFTICGNTGETPESLQKLHDWLIDMANEGLDECSVSIMTPYEGSPIWENSDKYNIHFNKEELNSSIAMYRVKPGEYKSFVHHDNLSREDIVAARDWIENDFYRAKGKYD